MLNFLLAVKHSYLYILVNSFGPVVCAPLGYKPFSSGARGNRAINVWRATEIRTAHFIFVIGIN